jgi:ABC-type nitrate/sulfonate/bicarbonate transport systems, periplasmic components
MVFGTSARIRHGNVKTRRRSPLAAFLIVPIVIAGCSSSNRSNDKDATVTQLSMGYVANVPVGVFPQMARDLGYFTQENISVKFVKTDPSTGVPGLIGGSLNILASGSEAILAAAKGADVEFVGSTANGSIFHFITDSKITDFKQLEGKIIGAPTLQSITVVAIKQLLTAHGVDVSKVKFVASGVSPHSVAALQGGQISAAAVSAPYNTVAAEAGFKDWGTTDTLGAKPLLSAVFVVKKSWAASHRSVLEGFLRAVQHVVRDVHDPAKSAHMTDVMSKTIDSKRSYIEAAIKEFVDERNGPGRIVPADLHTDDSVLESTTKGFMEIGVLPPDTDTTALANKLIDPTYAAGAYKETNDGK